MSVILWKTSFCHGYNTQTSTKNELKTSFDLKFELSRKSRELFFIKLNFDVETIFALSVIPLLVMSGYYSLEHVVNDERYEHVTGIINEKLWGINVQIISLYYHLTLCVSPRSLQRRLALKLCVRLWIKCVAWLQSPLYGGPEGQNTSTFQKTQHLTKQQHFRLQERWDKPSCLMMSRPWRQLDVISCFYCVLLSPGSLCEF